MRAVPRRGGVFLAEDMRKGSHIYIPVGTPRDELVGSVIFVT